jgi:phospholipid transport system substrate-binding protein
MILREVRRRAGNPTKAVITVPAYFDDSQRQATRDAGRIADEVIAIVKTDKDLQAGNSQKVVQLAELKVLPHFDFTRMTRLAVGRNWSQATPEQREALTKELRTLLVRTYSSSLSQYRNQTIEVKPLQASPGDEDVVVRTAVIQEGGPPIPIDYRMEKKPDGWKVYDVVIDGASLVTTYRGSFNDQIQRSGIDGLLKTLQERNRSPQPAKAAAK